MKDFMMIFVGKEYTDLGMSPEDMQNRMEKWFAWGSKMENAGILKGGEALTPQIRRITGANRTVTDLTSAEVKEIVGGFYLIQAENFDAVQKIAKDFPDYDLGNTVEIREIMVFEQ